jgi:restriction system protein
MAKKRGFFAELQHQQQVAARRREQQQRAEYRAQAAAEREAARTRAQAQRMMNQLMRASAAEQREAEREMKRLQVEAGEAEAAARTAELRGWYDQIDTMLEATLGVDDYVNLDDLRQEVEHPRFESEHERPLLPPPPLAAPVEPRYEAPPGEPGKLGGLFGGRKKYAEIEAAARREFDAAHAAWQAEVDQLPALIERQRAEFAQADARRQELLDGDRRRYAAESEAREQDVKESNERLEKLIANLAYGVDEAVHEYVSIVLSNSVYPDVFPVEHEFEYQAELKELVLTALVPSPDTLPTTKEFKYVRARDEISATSLPQKETKERYKGAVAQVAVRTLHEIFEADRAAWIQTITLTVAVDTMDLATGLPARIPLIAVAADRASFGSFDLANVVPVATLGHLGALVSKSPADLVPIDLTKGVRGR